MIKTKTTKRSGRTKRAAVAILIALTVLVGRIDPPAVQIADGRPKQGETR